MVLEAIADVVAVADIALTADGLTVVTIEVGTRGAVIGIGNSERNGSRAVLRLADAARITQNVQLEVRRVGAVGSALDVFTLE